MPQAMQLCLFLSAVICLQVASRKLNGRKDYYISEPEDSSMSKEDTRENNYELTEEEFQRRHQFRTETANVPSKHSPPLGTKNARRKSSPRPTPKPIKCICEGHLQEGSTTGVSQEHSRSRASPPEDFSNTAPVSAGTSITTPEGMESETGRQQGHDKSPVTVPPGESSVKESNHSPDTTSESESAESHTRNIPVNTETNSKTKQAGSQEEGQQEMTVPASGTSVSEHPEIDESSLPNKSSMTEEPVTEYESTHTKGEKQGSEVATSTGSLSHASGTAQTTLELTGAAVTTIAGTSIEGGVSSDEHALEFSVKSEASSSTSGSYGETASPETTAEIPTSGPPENKLSTRGSPTTVSGSSQTSFGKHSPAPESGTNESVNGSTKGCKTAQTVASGSKIPEVGTTTTTNTSAVNPPLNTSTKGEHTESGKVPKTTEYKGKTTSPGVTPPVKTKRICRKIIPRRPVRNCRMRCDYDEGTWLRKVEPNGTPCFVGQSHAAKENMGKKIGRCNRGRCVGN